MHYKNVNKTLEAYTFRYLIFHEVFGYEDFTFVANKVSFLNIKILYTTGISKSFLGE